MNKLAQTIGTVFGVGYLKPAPGTWGSAFTLLLVWLLHMIGGFPLILACILISFVIGLWAIRQITEAQDNADPSEVVIDELVGQAIALLPLSYSASSMGIPIMALWPGWIAAFLLFRLFDIWKPGPVGWADRRNDPLGVMLDDVIAGILAAIGVVILAGLAHGVIGV